MLEARQLTCVLPCSATIMLLHLLRSGRSLQGSGKTLAFGLPIMQLLMAERQAGVARRGPKDLKALVLAPTRELALQVGLAAAQASCTCLLLACRGLLLVLHIMPDQSIWLAAKDSQETDAWQGQPFACRCVTTCRRLGSPAASGWSQLLAASAWPNRSAYSGSSPRWASKPAVRCQCGWQACLCFLWQASSGCHVLQQALL